MSRFYSSAFQVVLAFFLLIPAALLARAQAQSQTPRIATYVLVDDGQPPVQPLIQNVGYAFNDGGSGNARWGAGNNEIGGIHRFEARGGTDTISSMQFQAEFLPLGSPARIAIWQDNGSGNPANAILLHQQSVTLQSNVNGQFNTYVLSAPVSVSGTFYVGFLLVSGPGNFAATYRIVPAAQYSVGSTYLVQGAAGGNLANLASNYSVDEATGPIVQQPGYFLLRATGSNSRFTYQGRLKQANASFTGSADMRFGVYQSIAGGSPLATPLLVRNVAVTDGLFTVQIPFDFNTLFFSTTSEPFLEIAVRTNPLATYTTLSPRQPITQAPLAINAMASQYASNVPWTGIYDLPPFLANPVWQNVSGGINTTAGNVGIGVSNPQLPLDINGRLQLRGADTNDTPGMWLASPAANPQARAFVGLQSASSVGFYSPTIGWGLTMNTNSGYVGINRQTPIGASRFDINTAATSGSYGGMYMETLTGGWPFYGYFAGNSGAAWTYYRGTDNTWRIFNNGDQFVLTNSGLLSLGTGGVSASGYRLELPNTAGPAGQGRANAWVTYSSRELKQNIQTLKEPLAIINQLRGVSFDWRAALADGSRAHDLGFIAEEVADVLPQLVTRTPEGKATGLDYGRVVPITVEAIKAQQQRIDALQAENADLKARLDRIESTLRIVK